MCCFLRDADQLPTFRSLLHIYEQGSGARNSWPKTHMLRVGALRDSDYLPPGWVDSKDEVAGQTSVDCSGAVIRYLGIFLGAPEQVARKWHERVTQKMERRMTEWAQRGMPRTREGRNVVTKNSVFACAWFMVQNQTPPNLEHMLEVWYQQEWGFIEASLASSLHDGKRSPKVNRHVLVQDYAEGGQRHLNLEIAVRSQYIRQIRSLLDPRPFPNKEIVLYWVNKVYGNLRMGWRILISNCDFLMLNDDDLPAYWRYVLQMYGGMHGLVPNISQADFSPELTYTDAARRTVKVRDQWTPREVLMEPTNYNQNIGGSWGARVV